MNFIDSLNYAYLMLAGMNRKKFHDIEMLLIPRDKKYQAIESSQEKKELAQAVENHLSPLAIRNRKIQVSTIYSEGKIFYLAISGEYCEYFINRIILHLGKRKIIDLVKMEFHFTEQELRRRYGMFHIITSAA